MPRVAREQLPQPGKEYSQDYMLRLVGSLNRILSGIESSVPSNSILNGDGPPASSLGISGDLYLDRTAVALYGNINGLWVLASP